MGETPRVVEDECTTSTRRIETFYEALYNFWGGVYFFGAPTPYVDGCAMPLMLP